MKQQAVLDFSDDGKAVVQIPDVGEIAYINMFGFSQISEVERDIEAADPERKRFLEKYLQIYKEMYGENHQTDENVDKAKEKLHDAHTAIMPVIETCFRAYNDYDNEYKYDDAINVLSDDEFLCVEESLDDYGINNLIVNNFKLAHSSAWYLMGHVNADIEATKIRIEEQTGLSKFVEDFPKSDFNKEIRDCNSYDEQLEILKNKYQLTTNQAKYIMNYNIKEMCFLQLEKVNEHLEEYKKQLAFLYRLKSFT